MADGGGGYVFLLLPRVLLEGGASMDGLKDGLRMEVIGLLAVEHLLEQVRAEGGRELSRTMLPIGGRPPLYVTRSEQVSKETSLLLADLGLSVQDTKPFFAGIGRFITFTFFSQPEGNSPAYKYHSFFISCH